MKYLRVTKYTEKDVDRMKRRIDSFLHTKGIDEGTVVYWFEKPHAGGVKIKAKIHTNVTVYDFESEYRFATKSLYNTHLFETY